MSSNTVRKYVQELEERGLIRTERTSITTHVHSVIKNCFFYHITCTIADRKRKGRRKQRKYKTQANN